MRVLVRTLEGKKLIVGNLRDDETVYTVKQRVESMFGVRVSDQKLFFQESILDDSQHLYEYGISHDSTIDMVVARVVINVRTSSGSTVQLLSAPDSRFGELRKRIGAEKLGAPAEYQILIFQGKQLNGTSYDEHTLEQLGFTTKCENTIQLSARLHGG